VSIDVRGRLDFKLHEEGFLTQIIHTHCHCESAIHHEDCQIGGRGNPWCDGVIER